MVGHNASWEPPSQLSKARGEGDTVQTGARPVNCAGSGVQHNEQSTPDELGTKATSKYCLLARPLAFVLREGGGPMRPCTMLLDVCCLGARPSTEDRPGVSVQEDFLGTVLISCKVFVRIVIDRLARPGRR